jgi:hypothetical protein
MPTLDSQAREVGLRFAIVGPVGSGRRAILKQLHATFPPSERTEITEANLGNHQLLSFDFAPGELLPAAEFKARATLLVFSGPLSLTAVCARVFADLDALVFVADGDPKRQPDNVASLRDLGRFKFLNDVPVILFYNKRDRPDATSVAELEASINSARAPHRSGSAASGEGMDGLLSDLVRACFAAAR